MSEPTLPSNALGQYYNGDIYLADGTAANTGSGSLYIANGNFLVATGVTALQKTYINTNTGGVDFIVEGSGNIDAQVGGTVLFEAGSNATDAIRLNATSGGIDIDSLLTLNATSGGIMTLESTDTSAGAVTINANGIGASLVLNATGTGNDIDINAANQVTLDSTTLTSIQTGTGLGAITLISAGGVAIDANHSTNGKIVLTADSTATDALRLNATAGGIDVDSAGAVDIDAVGVITISTTATGTNTLTLDSTGEIKIDSTDTINGVKIATETSAVPVLIGTTESTTTVAGDLIVQGDYTVNGTTTTLNIQTLLVEDNLIQLNHAGGSIGIDSGVVIRRYQTANGSSTGNVIENATSSDGFVPQESGAFQAGSSTLSGTLVLSAHASDTDDFYNGWWIRITSGSGVDQVRRIKDYDGTSKTATIFIDTDNNTVQNPEFTDGLNLATAPAAADTYELYNQSSIALFWDESTNYYKLAGLPNSDLPGSPLLIADDTKNQYSKLNSGEIRIDSQIHRNVLGSASGTTITMTLKDIDELVSAGDKVLISDSALGFTPSINGTYTVTGTTANTMTFTVGSSTTSAADASATVKFLNTSKLLVNTIELADPSFGIINIPGLFYTEDIGIGNDSTAAVSLTAATTNFYGAYRIIVEDISTPGNAGSMATFDITKSSSSGAGNINRTSLSKGDENQRINMVWQSGSFRPALYHAPAGSDPRTNTYRVRVYRL
jgi:hypothetical protein